VKFTEAGGRVDLNAQLGSDGGVDISIRDTGIGMSAEDIARVGEPFLQADGRLARKFEGTGLGLAIAKRLTELHGGRLKFESTPGVGTTATIHLPPARSIASETNSIMAAALNAFETIGGEHSRRSAIP
jgi:signal transduction histidine kinase